MTVPDVPTRPEDLRALDADGLRRLAATLRTELVERVGESGGHLGPNLGVVELTIALHRVFDSPRDPVLFDTGHQTYAHKMLTGRAAGFRGLRRRGGLSGYPSRAESRHDWIESSHASAALSYADGLATAFHRTGDDDRCPVVVVGDGALTGGMCWEALNNLADGRSRRLVLVVNDNGYTYSPTVGGLAANLARLRSDDGTPGLFDALGIPYLGPVDGHDVTATEAALRRAREYERPVVVHAVTVKGSGHPAAERHPERLHQVAPAAPDPATPPRPTWNDVFAESLIDLATDDDRVVALTAGMPGPTGLAALERRLPGRCLDVGIAEQHAMTTAAGLAAGGLSPVVALYSTFLNRAFDQLVMDVALLDAPVTVVLQRAGVTGDDGPSHNGVWDLPLLGVVPGITVAAPRDASTLRQAMSDAVGHRGGPTVVRFPKGVPPDDIPAEYTVDGIDVLHDTGRDVLIVAVGPMAEPALAAAGKLAAAGVGVTVADPRRPIPTAPALVGLAAEHGRVVSWEDGGAAGGVGSALATAVRDAGSAVPVHVLGTPRSFLTHGTRDEVLAAAGLDVDGAVAAVTRWLDRAR